MIIIRIIVLSLFLFFVENYPKLKPYSFETKFNFYRSLMCIFFSLYSFENIVNNFVSGYKKPFDFKTDSFTDISKWFISYLIVDVGKMVWMKNNRWDLYVHHIWCLATYGLAFYYGKIGFLANMVLVAEVISIVSGVDSQFMEDKEMDKSKACKVYRKNIIKYLRQPLWVFCLLVTLYHAHNLPLPLFCNYIIGPLVMIYLDRYWEKKCDKVIEST
jgi:hypothetical protein